MPIPPDLTDIVTMLRKVDANHEPSEANDLMTAAANEIERLRADLDGAAHNRFFDQRDAYFEGLKDAK